MQAWLNHQAPDEVLGWHSHEGYNYHGYIAVDPKATVTEFEHYEVRNRSGQIYIGRSLSKHRVVNKRRYAGRRTTIGFDLVKPGNSPIDNMGFIPLLLGA